MVQCGRAGGEEIMRWLFAVVLPFLVPMADVTAQELSAAVLSSTSSPIAGFPAPQPEPLPQTIRDDAVKDTWELGLGYALVGFRSGPFNATASGLNTTLSYLLSRSSCGGRKLYVRICSAELQQSNCEMLFLWRGPKAQLGRRQIAAICARTPGRRAHVPADGV